MRRVNVLKGLVIIILLVLTLNISLAQSDEQISYTATQKTLTITINNENLTNKDLSNKYEIILKTNETEMKYFGRIIFPLTVDIDSAKVKQIQLVKKGTGTILSTIEINPIISEQRTKEPTIGTPEDDILCEDTKLNLTKQEYEIGDLIQVKLDKIPTIGQPQLSIDNGESIQKYMGYFEKANYFPSSPGNYTLILECDGLEIDTKTIQIVNNKQATKANYIKPISQQNIQISTSKASLIKEMPNGVGTRGDLEITYLIIPDINSSQVLSDSYIIDTIPDNSLVASSNSAYQFDFIGERKIIYVPIGNITGQQIRTVKLSLILPSEQANISIPQTEAFYIYSLQGRTGAESTNQPVNILKVSNETARFNVNIDTNPDTPQEERNWNLKTPIKISVKNTGAISVTNYPTFLRWYYDASIITLNKDEVTRGCENAIIEQTQYGEMLQCRWDTFMDKEIKSFYIYPRASGFSEYEDMFTWVNVTYDPPKQKESVLIQVNKIPNITAHIQDKETTSPKITITNNYLDGQFIVVNGAKHKPIEQYVRSGSNITIELEEYAEQEFTIVLSDKQTEKTLVFKSESKKGFWKSIGSFFSELWDAITNFFKGDSITGAVIGPVTTEDENTYVKPVSIQASTRDYRDELQIAEDTNQRPQRNTTLDLREIVSRAKDKTKEQKEKEDEQQSPGNGGASSGSSGSGSQPEEEPENSTIKIWHSTEKELFLRVHNPEQEQDEEELINIPISDSQGRPVYVKIDERNTSGNKSVAEIRFENGDELQDSTLVLNGIEKQSPGKIYIEDLENTVNVENKTPLKSYAIELSYTNFTNGTFTTKAKGTQLWKCKEYNFTTRTCFGTWQKIKNLYPGQEYDLEVYPEDPAYAELGLATVNTLKSIYYPNETAEILMVVLDSEGFLVHGANVTLNVENPQQQNTTFRTSDGSIGEIDTGIYKAEYTSVADEGMYLLHVVANSDSVNNNFTSYFIVKNHYEFDIQRNSPVTTDPWQGPIDSQITIVSKNHTGTFNVTEKIPSNFSLINATGADVIVVNDKMLLTWTNLTSSSTVSYTAQPPLVTPELFNLGPAIISYAGKIFEEARPWYLAIDPETNWIDPSSNTGGSSVSNPANAYDSDDDFADFTTDGSNWYYYGYDFSSLPGLDSVTGIEINLRGARSGGFWSNGYMEARLSWDSGSTWTNWQNTADWGTSISDHYIGGSSDDWGHSWTRSELLNNFRVQARWQDTSIFGSSDGELSHIPVKIYYTEDPAPEVTALNLPADNSSFIQTIIDFNFTATDNSGITNCSLYMNDSGWTLMATTTSVTNNTETNITYDASSLSEGAYAWNIRCWDDTGLNNAYHSTNYTLNIDTTPPTITLIDPSNSEIISGSPYTLNATITDSFSGPDTVMFYYRDGGAGPWNLACTANSYPYECAWDTSAVTPGTDYQVRATGNDSAGNMGNNDTHTSIEIEGVATIANIQCFEQGVGWQTCDNIAYSEILQEVRAACTPSAGDSIQNVTFTLTNIDDSNTFFEGTVYSESGGYYTYDNSDIQIQDSGNFTLTTTCWQSNVVATDTSWQVPWGTLTATLLSPSIDDDVSKDVFFSFRSRISCSGGECGSVLALLDPGFNPGSPSSGTPDAGQVNDLAGNDEEGGSYTDTQNNDNNFYAVGEEFWQADTANSEIELEFNISSIGISEDDITDLELALSYCHSGADSYAAIDCNGDLPIEKGFVGSQDVWLYNYETGLWDDVGDLDTTNGESEVTDIYSPSGTLTDYVSNAGIVRMKTELETDSGGWFSDAWLAIDLAELTVTYEILKSGPVSTTPGDIPFYTTNSNPKDFSDDACLANMSSGDFCDSSWAVNTTGQIGSENEFWMIYNASDYPGLVSSTESTHINLTIIANSAPSVSSIDISPVEPSSSTDLNCSFTITDTGLDIIAADVDWYRNGSLYSSGSTNVTSGIESSIILSSSNTQTDETWLCGVTPSDDALSGSQVNSTEINITEPEVKLNAASCEINGSIWAACNSTAYGDTITRTRANCTYEAGAITSAFFELFNTEDANTYFSASTTSSSGDYWIYDNADVLLDDSGTFSFNASCYSGGLQSLPHEENWILPWGTLAVSLIDPLTDYFAIQNYLFNFTTQVSCIGGECGDVQATIDPARNPNATINALNPEARWILNSDGSDVVGTHDGTGSTSPSFVTSIIPNPPVPNAGDFDGTNQYNVPDDPLINTGGGYQGNQRAISAWFVADTIDTTNNGRAIWSQGGGTNSLNMYVYDDSGTKKIFCNAVEDGGSSNDYVEYEVQEGALYHVGCMFDFAGNGRIDMYINGTLADSDTSLAVGTELGSHGNNNALGGVDQVTRNHLGNSLGGAFDGRIADVVYWSNGAIITQQNFTDIYLDGTVSGKGIIPMNSGTPFYTNTQNPANETTFACLNSMGGGDSCQTTWEIMTTGELNTTWEFFTYYTPLNYSAYVSQGNSSIINVTIRQPSPPEFNEVSCYDGSTWSSCSSFTWGEYIRQVRADCVPVGTGEVSNVSFMLRNVPDNAVFFNDTVFNKTGQYWVYDNPDVQIQDSGLWNLRSDCTVNPTTTNETNWTVSWGTLSSSVITPANGINVTQNSLFNFTSQVSCSGGECGYVNATLDPIAWWNTDYKHRTQLNITNNDASILRDGHTVNVTINHSGLVSDNKSLSSGDDIRIVYYNGSSFEINRTSSNWNSASTTIEFMLQENISASSFNDGYFVYYDNVAATSPPEDYAGVYVIYDDFEDASLDTRWSPADNDADTGTSFSESSGELNIDAGGADTWTGDDEFGAVFETISGDFDAETRINAQENTNGWAKAGLMIRNDMQQPGTSTGYSFMTITPSNDFTFQRDATEDGFLDASTGGGSTTYPGWLRLEKRGTTFEGFYAENDPSIGGWTTTTTETLSSANNEQDIGLGVTSHSSGTLSLVDFEYIKVTRHIGTAPTVSLLSEEESSKGIIPMNSGTPFYTTNQNPYSYSQLACLADMNAGDSCQTSWLVNATGQDATTWEFFTIYESTNYSANVSNEETSRINITILANVAPQTTTPIIGPASPGKNTDLQCNFTVSDPSNNDNLYAIVTWYNNNVSAYNESISVTNGQLVSRTLDSANTSAGEFWHCAVTPYDDMLYGTQQNSTALEIIAQNPVVNSVSCELDGSWSSCNGFSYADNLTRIRAQCSDTDGYVVNASFNFRNEEDDKTYFSATTTDNSSGYWVYDNSNIQILDSGTFNLSVVCYDNDNEPGYQNATWQLPWGTLGVTLNDPVQDINVTQYEFFNFSSTVTCTGGECGYVNATLDPTTQWWNPDYEKRKLLNVTTGSNTPQNGYQNYTVEFTSDTTGSDYQTDGEDIRVVYWNGTQYQELDRQLVDVNTANTKIRFALEEDISANSYDDNYYLYYSNNQATNPPENLSRIYLWYDDASMDRESDYIQGRVDESAHGGGWGDSVSWNSSGYYTFDTTDNNADSVRPSAIDERDVYIEYEHYQTNAYSSDMTSGPLIRWDGTGTGASESSSHWYNYEMADSTFFGGYTSHDTITADTRSAVVVNNALLGDFPANTWTRLGIAAWGTNPTNLNAYYNNESGGFSGYRFAGTHSAGSDNENTGQAGLWLQQDAGRVRNIIIRRYTEPEPSISIGNEEQNGGTKGIIPMNSGNPFYTSNQNPYDYATLACLADMKAGDSCQTDWQVNATGNSLSTWEFFTIYESTNYSGYVSQALSQKINITIIGKTAPSVSDISIIPQDPLPTDYLFCNYTLSDPNPEDTTLNATINWYNSSQLFSSQSTLVPNGDSQLAFLDPAYTSLGETWWCGVQGRDSELTGPETNSSNVTIVSVRPPEVSSLECFRNNNVWTSCSNMQFGDVLGGVRAVCDSDQYTIDNATFSVTNIPDSDTYFNQTTLISQGSYWIHYENITMNNSGTFNFTATCTDSNSSSATDSETWFLPWGQLSPTLVSPNSDTSVEQFQFFNFTSNLTCLNGECGNVNVTLDPINWYSNNWSFRKNITVDNSLVTADLSDFPMMISITDSNLSANAQSNGDDILFTSSDGTTKLPHEIEMYNSSTGNLVAWVSLNLSSSADTTIYMYYGNNVSSNQEDAANVWDSDYLTVYHMDNDPSTSNLLDSSANSNDAVPSGVPSSSLKSGKVGYAIDFDGSGDYFSDSDAENYLGGLSAITIEAWIRNDDTASTDAGWIFGKDSPDGTDSSIANRYDVSGASSNCVDCHKYGLSIDTGSTVDSQLESTDNTQSNSWQHLVLTWASGDDIKLWINSSQDTGAYISNPGITGTITSVSNLLIGLGAKDSSGSSGWDGFVDELRISSINRSDDWIAVSYNNQETPGSFYSVGSEESRSKGIIPMNSGEPFYTTTQNPMYYSNDTCLVNMIAGDSCQITWEVNATGELNTTWEFFTIHESDLLGLVSDTQSQHINITISTQAAVPPVVSLSPANGTYSSSASLNLICSATDNLGLSNASLYGNWSGWHLNETNSLSGTGDSAVFSKNFTDGVYLWNCLVYDTDGNSVWHPSNYTFTVDTLEPEIILNSPEPEASFSESSKKFNFTVTDNIASEILCNLTIDNNVESQDIIASNGFMVSEVVNSLSQGIHYWNVTCIDDAGNINTSLTRNFTVQDVPPNVTLVTENNTFQSSTTVNLRYNATDNNDVISADLYLNGEYNRTDSSVLDGFVETFTLIGMQEGIYNWTVNVSDISNLTAQADWRWFTVDFTAPFILLDFPDDNHSSSTSTLDFNFTVTDNLDTQPVCELVIDGISEESNYTSTNSSGESVQVSNISDGQHYWNVTCVDDAGNQNTSVTNSFNVSELPSVTLDAPFNTYAQTSENISLQFTASDNTGLASCQLLLDGQQNETNTSVVNGQATNFSLTGLGSGKYNWTVQCNDTFGLSFTPAAWNFTIDSVVPGIVLHEPIDGQIFNSQFVDFNWTATDNLDQELVCDLTIDGLAVDSFNSTDGVPVNTTQFMQYDGLHYWNVTCVDDAGNFNTSQTRNFTTQNPPTITLEEPFNSSIFNYTNVSFLYLVFDSDGVANTSLIFNGSVQQVNLSPVNGGYNTFEYNFTSDGIYLWSVNATDNNSLEGTSNYRLLTIDTLPPNITYNSPTLGETIGWNNVSFDFTVDDNLDPELVCDVYVNEAIEWQDINVTNGATITRNKIMNDGSYNWSVYCIDHANNTNAQPLINFTVYAPPNVTLDSPVDVRTTSRNITFLYTPYDDIGLQSCMLIFDGQNNETDNAVEKNVQNEFNLTSLPDGMYNWTVQCTDTPDANTFSPVPQNFTIDNTGPFINLTRPLIGETFNQNNITFNWTATDYPDVPLSCTLYVSDPFGERNATNILGTSGDVFGASISNLSDGSHSWNVTCVDDLNNTNTSESITFFINQPDLYLNNSMLSFNNSNPDENETLQIIANVSNIGGLDATNALVEFWDGDPATTGVLLGNDTQNVAYNSTALFTFDWNITSGYHEIYVLADPYDSIGELNETNNNATVNISVLKSVILSPPDFTYTNDTTPEISFNMTDYTGGQINYTIFVDGSANGQFGTSTDSEIVSLNLTSLADGNRQIVVEALDLLGRRKNSTAITITVDTTGPTTNYVTPDNYWFNTTNQNITFNITDAFSTIVNYTTYLNGQINETGNTTSGDIIVQNYSLSEGAYNYTVEATDELGNVQNSTLLTFYVDFTNPTANITTQNETWFNTASPSIDFTITDTLDTILNYTLYVNGSENDSGTVNNGTPSSGSLSGLANEDYLVGLSGTDDALNTGYATPIVIKIDTVEPTVTLDYPDNDTNFTVNSLDLNFTTSDNRASFLECTLTLDGSNENPVNVTNGNQQNISVSGLSGGYHFWNVTCVDEAGNSDTSETRQFYVEQPDIFIDENNIFFSNNDPRENETINVTAQIENIGTSDAGNFIVQFFKGDPDNGGVQINGNITMNLSTGQSKNATVETNLELGETTIFVVADAPLATDGVITEENENNNAANKSITVASWHYVFGQTGDTLVVRDANNGTLFDWLVSNSSGSNLFSVDSDSAITWNQLQALGRDTSNNSAADDFEQLDLALGSENFTDNVNNTFTSAGSPIETSSYTVYGRDINNIALVNSTNNTNFKTGILWDSADGGAEYSGGQDVVFMTQVQESLAGYNGTNDYEMRVPALLRSYTGSTDTIDFYIELK